MASLPFLPHLGEPSTFVTQQSNLLRLLILDGPVQMAHGDMILGVRLYALYSKKLWIAVLFGVMLNVLGA